ERDKHDECDSGSRNRCQLNQFHRSLLHLTPFLRRRGGLRHTEAPAAFRYGCHPVGIFGAASLMKSTGAGGRGFEWRCIATSSGRRLPLRRLHGAHEVTTFSQTESPPRLRGTTWSSVSRPPLVPQ